MLRQWNAAYRDHHADLDRVDQNFGMRVRFIAQDLFRHCLDDPTAAPEPASNYAGEEIHA